MFYVLISGKAGSGKDTAGLLMKQIFAEEYFMNAVIAHYGDPVKMIAEKYFEWDGKKDTHGRTLLQYIGNDTVRNIDPDFWADFLVKSTAFFVDEFDCVIVPDTRYPNEIEIPKQHCPTYTIRINSGFSRIDMTDAQKQNPSETSLDDYPFQYTIQNDGTTEELANNLRKIAHEIYRHEYII